MPRRDLKFVTIIGAAVGLLAQPVLSNVILQVEHVLPFPRPLLRLGFFLFFLILAPLALFVASLLSRFIKIAYQFAKFAAVGSLNSFVDLGVFNTETLLLGHLPSTTTFAIFKTISFLAGTTNSFFWNKYWTFDSSHRATSGEVVKFYSIAIGAGLVNVAVATAVAGIAPAGIPANLWVNDLAPLAGIFAALLLDFVGYKFFVFKKPQG